MGLSTHEGGLLLVLCRGLAVMWGPSATLVLGPVHARPPPVTNVKGPLASPVFEDKYSCGGPRVTFV